MTSFKELLECICYNDNRNPVFSYRDPDHVDSRSQDTECYCDNCFSGRTDLAVLALKIVTCETCAFSNCGVDCRGCENHSKWELSADLPDFKGLKND